MASYDKVIGCSSKSLLSLSLALWSIYVLYLLPAMWSGMFCSTYVVVVQLIPRYSANAARLVLRCSPYWSSACPRFGVLQPLLSRVFCIAPWDSLSGLCASWIVCLASRASDWQVHPRIACLVCGGYLLLGVHPSMTIVKLIMIGYRCNSLDG